MATCILPVTVVSNDHFAADETMVADFDVAGCGDMNPIACANALPNDYARLERLPLVFTYCLHPQTIPGMKVLPDLKEAGPSNLRIPADV